MNLDCWNKTFTFKRFKFLIFYTVIVFPALPICSDLLMLRLRALQRFIRNATSHAATKITPSTLMTYKNKILMNKSVNVKNKRHLIIHTGFELLHSAAASTSMIQMARIAIKRISRNSFDIFRFAIDNWTLKFLKKKKKL